MIPTFADRLDRSRAMFEAGADDAERDRPMRVVQRLVVPAYEPAEVASYLLGYRQARRTPRETDS